MPAILRLTLRPIGTDGQYLTLTPVQAHGWFLGMVQAFDTYSRTNWFLEWHEGSQVRPYSLTPGGLCTTTPLSVKDVLGNPSALRIGFADDERARMLCAALPYLELPPAHETRCRLARFPAGNARDPDYRSVSWADLADAPAAERLCVHFLSPMAFSHRGQAYPLPEPARLVNSWKRSWELFAPALPDGAEELSLEGLLVADFELTTRGRPLHSGLRVGCRGSLTFQWVKTASEEQRRTLAALARISEFLGTGAKTTMGMGQTRIEFL